jgi:flagellar hook-length control protein FliK
MKVDGDKSAAPVAPKGLPSPETKPGQTSKSFSKLLGEKSEKKKRPGETLDPSDEAALGSGLIAGAVPQQQFPAEIKESRSARPGLDSALVRDLVQEIVLVTQPTGAQAVDVQFNSRTLQNLKVRISKDGEQISIRFSSPNDTVSQLLSRNVEQLSSALAARGVPAVIDIHTGTPASMSDDTRGAPGEQRRDQRQGQQQKRQR